MNSSSQDLTLSASSFSPAEHVLGRSPPILPPELCSPPPSPLLLSSSEYFRSLARRLKRFDFLLPALRELREVLFVPDPGFRLIGPKVIKLFEITRDTLQKAGIELWPHSPCFVSLRPHKKAYFILLEQLKSRGNCLDSALRNRWLKLTCRLSKNFEIQIDPAYDLYLPPQPRKQRVPITTEPTPVGTGEASRQLCKFMPPPDVFPPSQGISSQSLLGPRRLGRKPLDLWDLIPVDRPSHPSCLRRPMSQRFGIFCTGKTSMLQPLGRGRTLSRFPRHPSF